MINSLKRFFFCFWLTAKFFLGETWVNIILRPLGLIITFRYVLEFLMRHFRFSFYSLLSYQQIALFRQCKICHYIMRVLYFNCHTTKKEKNQCMSCRYVHILIYCRNGVLYYLLWETITSKLHKKRIFANIYIRTISIVQ